MSPPFGSPAPRWLRPVGGFRAIVGRMPWPPAKATTMTDKTTTPPLNPNMALWRKVCTTRPEDTSHVGQRGGFTAISAYSQIATATAVFGPCGKGWGWSVEYTVIDDLVVASISFWWADSAGKTHSFPAVGAAVLRSGGRVDHDAHKKAQTDAITKALSMLGWNHDIFRGRGCTAAENKYIVAQQPSQQPTGPGPTAQPAADPGPGDDWFDQPVGFGKYKETTWREMAMGNPGGQRHQYLHYLAGLDPKLSAKGEPLNNPSWIQKNLVRARRVEHCLSQMEAEAEVQETERRPEPDEYLQPEDVDLRRRPKPDEYTDEDCPF